MNSDRRLQLRLLPGLLLIFALSASSLGDSVRLKASVRLPADADAVRLSHIADLEGAAVEPYADLLIAKLDSIGDVLRIPITKVRACLDEAGVHWGLVNLSGRQVVVRPAADPLAATPVAMAGASLDPAAKKSVTEEEPNSVDVVALEIMDEPTLRGVVAAAFVHGLQIAPADLRLVFDHHALATFENPEPGTRFEIAPQGSYHSDRVTMTVRLWRDRRVQEKGTIAVKPLLRVDAPVLLREIDRNEIVGARDIDMQEQWLAPSQADLICSPADSVGRVASRRLHVGQILRTQHVRKRTIIERGDRVSVRCLVGGIVITLQAEARADGADGDSIELRKIGERSTFNAYVTGPGEATVDLTR